MVTLCSIKCDRTGRIQALINELQDVKPGETSNPSGSCAGASWIFFFFREGRMPGFLVGQEQQGHTGGTVPPQVPLGAAWTFLSQCMENPLEPLVGGQSPFQRLPKEDLVSFHAIPSPGSALGQQLPLELWMAGVGSLVSPQHLVPDFGDILGLR